MKPRHLFLSLLVCAMAAIPLAQRVHGSDYTAATTLDPAIDIENLKLLLKPLTKDELAVEANAWRDLLKAKVHEISMTKIESNRKKEYIQEIKEETRESIEEIKDAAKETVAEAAVQAEQAGTDEEPAPQTAPATEPPDTAEAAQADIKETADAAQEEVKEAADAEIEQQKDLKQKLDQKIAQLEEDKAGLVNRMNEVLAALELKGGDVEEYKKYISAIKGIEVDTADVAATSSILLSWLKSPEGGLLWARKIISFIVVLVIFKFVAMFLGSITRRAVAMNKKCSDLLRDFFVNAVRKIIMVIGIVVAVSMLGVNIGPLVAGIGAVGFIVGFALQGTLGNFAAGIMILMHRPYDVGDVIKTAGISGVVESMNLNTTTIKSFDNQIVVVPNGSIWGDVITNATGADIRRIDMTFGIGYGDDIAKALAILEDIVKNHPNVLSEPAPTIKLHELGDSSVNFICRPWSKTSDYWGVYWDITRAVKERFDAEGVTIPFPQRDVHIYNESVDNNGKPDAAAKAPSDRPTTAV